MLSSSLLTLTNSLYFLITLDVLIMLIVIYRVIMSRRSVGAALAWIYLVIFLPYLGAIAYLLIGENRIARRRRSSVRAIIGPYESWFQNVSDELRPQWEDLSAAAEGLERLGRRTTGNPALCGNRVELIADARDALESMRLAIVEAESSVHLEFYIWRSAGRVRDIEVALCEAAARGVSCRILVDGVGASDFLASDEAAVMRDAGVEIVEALPVGLLRSFAIRLDHRNHRKIVVVDGAIAYTGSLNMTDPDELVKSEEIGKWIDCMARIEGPAAQQFALAFLADWELETEDGLKSEPARDLGVLTQAGDATLQVIPSGPANSPEAIRDMLITTIFAARRELVMTTPYFIPGEPLIAAVKAAARRGVRVKIIVPKQNDSLFVRFATPSYFEELLEAGVEIHMFRGGLLHSKTICVDDCIAVMGSVNLDLRSFHLNFEISLFAYDETFASELRHLQEEYLASCEQVALDDWSGRPFYRVIPEKLARLMSPLL